MPAGRRARPEGVDWRLRRCRSTGRRSRYDDALAENERGLLASQRHGFLLSQRIELEVRVGRQASALKVYEELHEQSRMRHVPQTVLASALASIDRVEESVECFERAYREHDSIVNWNNWACLPIAFSRDARFPAVMKRIGLKPGRSFAAPD